MTNHPATFAMPFNMYGGASFSANMRFRQHLWRAWPNKPLGTVSQEDRIALDAREWAQLTMPYLLLVGHNPSRADATRNDMTIIREINLTRRMGYCCFVKFNVVDYCATLPSDLGKVDGLCSEDNYWELLKAAQFAGKIVLTMGDPHPRLVNYAQVAMQGLLKDHHSRTYCMGLTKSGWPRHTSRLANTVEPELLTDRWRSAA